MLPEVGFRCQVRRTQVLEEFQAGHPRRRNESKLPSLNERGIIAQVPTRDGSTIYSRLLPGFAQAPRLWGK